MRTFLILTGLFLFSMIVCCQNIDNSDKWIRQLENPKNELFKLNPDNYIEKYKSYDFATLIKPQTEFLGYIGQDYQRIYINFNSVEKVPDETTYLITGNTTVLNNKCDFTGTISIKQIREFKTFHLGADQMYRDSGIISQGLIIGDYFIQGNKDQPHSGEFKGIMSLLWYINKDGVLTYDRIYLMTSDAYSNNQYVGIWKDFITKTEKSCNWGEYRIPFSGDLDYGSAEFAPREKYYDKGWRPIK